MCHWECGTVLPHKAISLSWWLCLRGKDDWRICLALLPGWCGGFWRWGKLEVAYSPGRATHPAMFIPSLDSRALWSRAIMPPLMVLVLELALLPSALSSVWRKPKSKEGNRFFRPRFAALMARLHLRRSVNPFSRDRFQQRRPSWVHHSSMQSN